MCTADGVIVATSSLQCLVALLKSSQALGISMEQWASSDWVAAAMAGLGRMATLDSAADANMRLIELSATDGRLVAGMEPLANLLMTTVST